MYHNYRKPITLDKIIIKYLNNEITLAELEQLKSWLKTPENQVSFKAYVKSQHRLNQVYVKIDEDEAFAKITEQTNSAAKETNVRKLYTNLMKYAAIFVGIMAIGYSVFYFSAEKNNFQPALNQITLQLDDGSQMIIDEHGNTFVEKDNRHSEIVQQQDKLVYTEEQTDSTAKTEPLYNVLSVPYGRTFKLQLTDGTQVVLNAGTSIKYPTSFQNTENREVFLEGEAFFKVNKDSLKPFIVHTSKMNVRVLGTHFNVSAYKNEPQTNAVLVSGEIAAYPQKDNYKNSQTVFLAPGQQVLLKNGTIEVRQVDIHKYIAWLDGSLVFMNDNFKSILKQLERHYNVEIINEFPELNHKNFTGSFKDQKIEKVLETFQVHTPFEFKINQNKIIITKPL